MKPINKLALNVIGGVLLLAASFFFHLIAFLVVMSLVIYRLDRFRFIYMNTQGDAHESKYYQPVIPGIEYTESSVDEWGTIVGSDGQGSVRKNLPESKA